MNSDPPAALPAYTIGAVERDTRIGKDTLRVWERRYGFPRPERDVHGERLYPAEQVERLRHVKRLLDAGHRPGRVVPLGLAELMQLDGEPGGRAESPSVRTERAGEPADIAQLLDLLLGHDIPGLRRALGQNLLRRGLEDFVIDVALPLLAEVGQAWARGRVEVFEEHLCSETVETTLRSAMAVAPEVPAGARPRVLLSTLPFEAHGLGLQMAEALFLVQGCATMNLGRQTPLHDLLLAARAHQADIVALSFSASAGINPTLDGLAELRERLPPGIELWAGCPLPALQRRAPPGVIVLARLEAIGPELGRWRSQR